MEDSKSVGKGEEHWQFQDGVGNIKIEAPGEGRAPLQINPNIRCATLYYLLKTPGLDRKQYFSDSFLVVKYIFSR